MRLNIIVLSLTSVLMSINVYSQSIEGTFIAMSICKDGILVFADSRSIIKNEDGDHIGYFDKTQKVWKIENFLMAKLGTASYDERTHIYFSKILKESEAFSNKINLLIPEFIEIIENMSTKDKFDFYLEKSTFFSAGFENKVPFICVRNNDIDTCLNSSCVMSEKIGVDNKSYLYTASEYLHLIEQNLTRYIKSKNYKYLIGGPNTAYLIRKDNKIENLQNSFEYNDTLVCQTLFKVLNNDLPYDSIPPHNIKEVYDFLREFTRDSMCK